MSGEEHGLDANLRRHRRERGLTQEQLGRMAGFAGRSFIAQIENRVVQNPGVLTLYPIALALGCTFEDLLGVPPLTESTKARVRRQAAGTAP